MEVVCAWCKKLLYVVKVDVATEVKSHGICKECAKKLRKEKEQDDGKSRLLCKSFN